MTNTSATPAAPAETTPVTTAAVAPAQASTPVVTSAPAPAAAKSVKQPAAKKASAPAAATPRKSAAAPKVVKPVAKPVAAPAAKPAAKPAAQTSKTAKAAPVAKEEKPKKPKLVRDSFTIPKAEYVVLDTLKERALKLSREVKKSELLRAGIKALAALSDTALLAALTAVPAIKTGRPAAEKPAPQDKPTKKARGAKR